MSKNKKHAALTADNAAAVADCDYYTQEERARAELADWVAQLINPLEVVASLRDVILASHPTRAKQTLPPHPPPADSRCWLDGESPRVHAPLHSVHGAT